MKKIIILFFIIGVVCMFSNMDCKRTHMMNALQIYIQGDSGRQIEITYRQYGNTNNINYTEKVTLPYCVRVSSFIRMLKPHDMLDDGFLKIVTTNDDNTTKAVLYNVSDTLNNDKNSSFYIYNVVLSIQPLWIDSKDSIALGIVHNIPLNTPCIDSLWYYLQKNNYPCYMEFKGDATTKTVWAKDLNNWRQNNTP